jgi:hypothetical protein
MLVVGILSFGSACGVLGADAAHQENGLHLSTTLRRVIRWATAGTLICLAIAACIAALGGMVQIALFAAFALALLSGGAAFAGATRSASYTG